MDKRNVLQRSMFLVLPVAIVLFLFSPVAYSAQGNMSLSHNVLKKVSEYYTTPIDVTTNSNGEVVLKGQVRTLYDKYHIFDIVTTVPGVKSISNELLVEQQDIPDKAIEENVREELDLVHSILEPERIQIKADNGEVILSGTVSSYDEKMMAQTVASWQQGVQGISNEINVLPPDEAISDTNLEIELNDILANRFSVDNNVTISVNNGTVVLSGTAQRMWDKREIQKVFSQVRGVKEVRNNLEIRNTLSS